MAEVRTIAIAGDVMLGRLVNKTIGVEGFAYPWGNLLDVLNEADLFLINLECALTSQSQPWHDDMHKAFYFRADPSAVKSLQIAGVDFASLANNHAADFGAQGLAETVRVLDSAGIAHAGAGPTISAAGAPALLELDNGLVAVLAAADHPRNWAATADSPGINYIEVSTDEEDFAPIARSLQDARQRAGLVIFSMHWGPNMRPRPAADFRAFARAIITAGADVFWGHSAHLVQGAEIWNGKLILYDTGDFIDDYAVDSQLRNDLSALFLVRVRPPVIEELEIVPVVIDEMQVNLAHREEGNLFLERFESLCAEMGTELIRGPRTARIVVARPAKAGSRL